MWLPLQLLSFYFLKRHKIKQSIKKICQFKLDQNPKQLMTLLCTFNTDYENNYKKNWQTGRQIRDNCPPDSKWLQPPQGPRLGTCFPRLIVDYPEEARETWVFGLSVDVFYSLVATYTSKVLSPYSEKYQLLFSFHLPDCFPEMSDSNTSTPTNTWTAFSSLTAACQPSNSDMCAPITHSYTVFQRYGWQGFKIKENTLRSVVSACVWSVPKI